MHQYQYSRDPKRYFEGGKRVRKSNFWGFQLSIPYLELRANFQGYLSPIYGEILKFDNFHNLSNFESFKILTLTVKFTSPTH